MNIRKRQGISLIALVITIIIMLILAGVAISTITTGGIPFGKIKEAVNEHNQAALEEEKYMNQIYEMIVGPSIDTSRAIQVNAPVLAQGMTPIIWDEVKQEWVETTADAGWYSYEEQTGTTEQPRTGTSKWANVKMPDGSMFVWIPRYAYQITEGYHTGGEGVKGIIDVAFMKDTSYTDFNGNANYGGPTTAPTYNGDKQTNWIVHPVFRANTDVGGWTSELPGIWVAKFEASNIDNYGDDANTSNNASLTMQILPNQKSWRCIVVNNMVTVCQNATYGYNTKPNTIDSHIMKGTEWGAAAYLAHSQYGRNATEVSNNNSEYYTGRSAGTNIGADNTVTNYSYETLEGQLASTTGNVYGIYDMSGGSWEYVASYYSGYDVNNIQVFQNLILLERKYKKIYNSHSSENYGDAMYEINPEPQIGKPGWFYDMAGTMDAAYPVFRYGGNYLDKKSAGLFAFHRRNGGIYTNTSFRPVLVIENLVN